MDDVQAERTLDDGADLADLEREGGALEGGYGRDSKAFIQPVEPTQTRRVDFHDPACFAAILAAPHAP